MGFAHEAEQAGQRLSCAQHPCSAVGSQHYMCYPRLTLGRCCAANNTFRGLRSFVGTQDLAFVQYTTSEDWMYERPYHEELYDMTSDHYQCVPPSFRPDHSAWPVWGGFWSCDVQVGLLTLVSAGCRISATRPMLRWCRSCRRGWRHSGTAPGRAVDCLYVHGGAFYRRHTHCCLRRQAATACSISPGRLRSSASHSRSKSKGLHS